MIGDRQQGFTLLEVMVTMAIIAILTSIAIPNYLSWKSGYNIRGAVSQVQRDVNMAKMRAVEIRRQCRVVFSTNGYVIQDGSQVMHTPAGGWTNYRTKTFDNFLDITLTHGDGSAIVAGGEPIVSFSPRGLGNALDTVWVRHPDQPGAQVVVNATGRINVEWQ